MRIPPRVPNAVVIAMPTAHALTVALLAFLALSPTPPPATAQPPAPSGAYVPVATWRERPGAIPPATWHTPAGLAIAPTGRLATTDARLRRGEWLTADGLPDGTFGATGGAGDLVQPGHVALDAARDRVYVVDERAGGVAVFDGAGNRVGAWPLDGASGVAVAADGRVVVAERATDRVHVLGPDGAPLAAWGGRGAGPAQYEAPAGLAVAGDAVYAADRGNGRVVVTALDGTPRDVLRLGGAMAGAEPLDVAVDGDDVWVATTLGVARLDRATGQLRGLLEGMLALAVDVAPAHGLAVAAVPFERGAPAGVWRYRYLQSSGEPLQRLGQPVRVPGLFDGLEALAIGDDGRGYLTDVPERVQVLGLDGAVLGQHALDDPAEVAADAAGRLYVASGARLTALAADGTVRWTQAVGSRAPGGGVELVALDWDAAAGELVVLDGEGARLYALRDDGTTATDHPASSGRRDVASAVDVAVGGGARHVLDAGTRTVLRYAPDGRGLGQLALPEAARRLDAAPDGSLVVLAASGYALAYAPDGSLRARWDVARPDLGGSRPEDVAIDAAGRVYVVDGEADAVTVYAWDPAATPPPQPEPVAEGCALVADKRALPAEVALGEEVTLALTVRGACAANRTTVDVAVILDTSAPRSTFKGAREAVEDFVDRLDPSVDRLKPPGGETRLSADAQYLRRAIRRLDPTSEFALAPALEDAERELYGVRGRRDARKVVVVLLASDGVIPDEDGWSSTYALQRAAGQLKRRGATIFTVGLSDRADARVLRDVASSPSHVEHSRGNWTLADLMAGLAQRIAPDHLLRELEIVDVLADQMTLVTGSSAPPGAVSGPTIRWRFTDVGDAGAGVTLRIRPQAAGLLPTNDEAYADYVDAEGRAGRLVFPIPMVRVVAPTATPEPTATTPPEPTPTLRPSASPTGVASATATAAVEPTPGGGVGRVYLPVGANRMGPSFGW